MTRLKRRQRLNHAFQTLTVLSVLVGLLTLGALLFNVMSNGRLIVAMHAFKASQRVTLSLRAISRGETVTPYVRVSKVLDKGTPPGRPLQAGDALVYFLDGPLGRTGELWARLLNADEEALRRAELRWVPAQKQLFGKLKSVHDETEKRHVRLESVAPNSAAERAGLLEGDLIVAVAGQPLERSANVWEAVVLAQLTEPGNNPIVLEIVRDGQHLSLVLDAVKRARVGADPAGDTVPLRPFERNGWQAVLFLLTHFGSRYPELSGLLSAAVGSLYIVGLAALFAFPVGVGAALFLEEYAHQGLWVNLININLANLAGVPSVVYGLIGLEIFARGAGVFEGLGRSILAGSLTLALLILPIIIINTKEALKAVPFSVREAAYGLGATRWQVVRHHVLPYALPGVLTGIILALSRALGETAPLVLLGAFLYVPFVPKSPFDVFTVLPLQIFNWTSQPQDGYPNLAAVAILILLFIMLLLNGVAIVLRNRYQVRW